MARITTARAWANNEVAYIAWDVDGKIPGCLGFQVVRVYLDTNGNETDRVDCATWVAFKGQKNPNWLPQDTGVWPVQKCEWRDLTLRKRRDGMKRRPDEVRVRYEIRPLGDQKPGMQAVLSNGREMADIIQRDGKGKPILGPDGKPVTVHARAYEGDPRPLGYLAAATSTNPILVTRRRPPFQTTFTNGILAAQWLSNVLAEDGVIEKDELIRKLENPRDPHRKYLAGDVLPLIRELFAREGTFHLALYELEDEELEALLVKNANRIHAILSNSAAGGDGKWDARNSKARQRLADAGVDVQPRMFNNNLHIGHNKFVVHLAPDGTPRAVFTGSTNWTSTGVAGQTNNAMLIEDTAVATAFLEYWKRMKDDALAVPNPLSKAMNGNEQGAAFRTANKACAQVPLTGNAGITVWFSPNTTEQQKPTSKLHPPPKPPDLTEAYRLMRMAKEAIIFLAFYPAQSGVDCIIGEAIDIGRKDHSLIVVGAVSSPQAMPNYVAEKKDNKTGKILVEGKSPTTFLEGNVSVVRASKIDDRMMMGDLGAEQLTANNGIGAIIHDKIVVIDPHSPADCAVILGSHNLGFKASYSNDENMVIVRGHAELVAAYAVHVLDVYDHYRFRAIATEREKQGKTQWSGFLEVDDKWLDPYVARTKGAISRYLSR